MLLVAVSEHVEQNQCPQDEFYEVSCRWLRTLVKCVKFESMNQSSDVEYLNVFFNENLAIRKHLDEVRRKVDLFYSYFNYVRLILIIESTV